MTVGLGRAVSRKFNKVSKSQMQKRKTKTIKKRCQLKMMWAVRVYNE